MPAVMGAFSMTVIMLEARVLGFMCTLGYSSWSIFLEPSSTASLITISWLCDVQPPTTIIIGLT